MDRETDKKRKRERRGVVLTRKEEKKKTEGMGDKERTRMSSGKRGREEKEKGTAERQKASKSCMCVGSQPCQGPVSL